MSPRKLEEKLRQVDLIIVLHWRKYTFLITVHFLDIGIVTLYKCPFCLMSTFDTLNTSVHLAVRFWMWDLYNKL